MSIEQRLQASLNMDAVNGDAMERGVVAQQIREAVAELASFRQSALQQDAEIELLRKQRINLMDRWECECASRDAEIERLREKVGRMKPHMIATGDPSGWECRCCKAWGYAVRDLNHAPDCPLYEEDDR